MKSSQMDSCGGGQREATARSIFYVSVLPVGEKTVVAHGGEYLPGLEAFAFWQGSENAENEKEAPSSSNQEAASVLFIMNASFLFGTRRPGLEMGSIELAFFISSRLKLSLSHLFPFI